MILCHPPQLVKRVMKCHASSHDGTEDRLKVFHLHLLLLWAMSGFFSLFKHYYQKNIPLSHSSRCTWSCSCLAEIIKASGNYRFFYIKQKTIIKQWLTRWKATQKLDHGYKAQFWWQKTRTFWFITSIINWVTLCLRVIHRAKQTPAATRASGRFWNSREPKWRHWGDAASQVSVYRAWCAAAGNHSSCKLSI